MKKKQLLACPWLLAILLLTTIAPAQGEFTLSPYSRPMGSAIEKRDAFSPEAGAGSTSAPGMSKKPWLAALEALSSNILVWAFDRYITNQPYSHISWQTWKRNLRSGFAYDADTFFTNFLAHPYHGSVYYNTARSLGMNFWESIPYTVGGSLLWEEFGETTRPSINDFIMTTTGGICIGEVLFRLSSQILDDTATGGNRFWREFLATLVDPVRGLNRLFSGDSWRVRSANRQIREPIHGNFAVSEKLVSETAKLSNLKSSPGIEFDMVYGESTRDIVSRVPFDFIVLSGVARYRDSQVLGSVNAYAVWFHKHFGTPRGNKHMLGLFQHYDYMNIELIHMGGTSLTGGLISLFPLKNKFELNTSIQLGPLLFGASNNKYTQIEQRDYNYGMGVTGKLDIWLTHPKFGTLMLKLSHFQIYTLEGAALEADESHDYLTTLNAKYTVPVWDNLNLRFEYALYNRHLHFSSVTHYNTNESLVGVSLDYRF